MSLKSFLLDSFIVLSCFKHKFQYILSNTRECIIVGENGTLIFRSSLRFLFRFRSIPLQLWHIQVQPIETPVSSLLQPLQVFFQDCSAFGSIRYPIVSNRFPCLCCRNSHVLYCHRICYTNPF